MESRCSSRLHPGRNSTTRFRRDKCDGRRSRQPRTVRVPRVLPALARREPARPRGSWATAGAGLSRAVSLSCPRPTPPFRRSGQARRSARPPRPGLRLVHRRLRHARPHRSEGSTNCNLRCPGGPSGATPCNTVQHWLAKKPIISTGALGSSPPFRTSLQPQRLSLRLAEGVGRLRPKHRSPGLRIVTRG